MALISDDYIRELEDTPIMDLIHAEGIKTFGRGDNVQISCIEPSHEDKSPSMSVNTNTGAYYCQGCGCTGGGVISMYATIHGLNLETDFRRTVEDLSGKLGKTIEYQSTNDPLFSQRERQTQALKQVIQDAVGKPYFDDDKERFLSFLEKREIGKLERQHAKIGYLAKNFANSPTAKKYEAELLDAGILTKNEDTGQIYSRFAKRIIMPITNPKGHIIGIAGRVSEDAPVSSSKKQPAKYLNTSETISFKKHQTLYGLNHAIENLTGRLENIDVVEGYFDVITAQTKGIKGTVATMGTAATTDHIKTLQRYTNGVTFIFDPDNAGKNASFRALKTALPFADKLNVRFCMMPEIGGEKLDPDAYLKSHTTEEYIQLKSQALPIEVMAARYVVGDKTESLQQAIQGGMLERGHEVFQGLPNGMVKPIYAAAIAHEVSQSFNLNLTPEQLGMSIDQQERIYSLTKENEQFKKDIGNLSTELEQANSSLAQIRKSKPANNERSTLLQQSEALEADSKKTLESIKRVEKSVEQMTKHKDISVLSEKAKSIEKELADSFKAIETAQKEANKPSKDDSSKNEDKKSKANSPEFSLGFFRCHNPQKNHWVTTASGEIGKVTQVYPNGLVELESISGDKMPDAGVKEYATLVPTRVIKSKYDNEKYKIGDSILLINNTWVGSIPSAFSQLAISLKSNPSEIINNEYAIGSIKKMLADIGQNGPQNETNEQFLERIGYDKFIIPMKTHEAPPNLFRNGVPDKGDYIVKTNGSGVIYSVASIENGSNIITARNTQTQLEEVIAPSDILILRYTAKAISKFDSNIAKKDQPIFKFEKDGPWMGEVPDEWMESALPKESTPSPSFG